MCAISGVVSASGSLDPERVARMSTRLAHRAPDSAGEFSDGPAALAARLWHERHVGREPGCVRVPELLAKR
jgi:asparagine synthetase B (glutamine-hydrolysing)